MNAWLSHFFWFLTFPILLATPLEAITQTLDAEIRFVSEYQQFTKRTEVSAARVHEAIAGSLTNNIDAKLAFTDEIINLRAELAQFLNQATRYNISLQKNGKAESRDILYLTEAGSAMMDELGIMLTLLRRNEVPLIRSLEYYRVARKILESEIRQR